MLGPACGHGLPKIHKPFDILPKFRPIIDTTGTTHYSVGKYISGTLAATHPERIHFKGYF